MCCAFALVASFAVGGEQEPFTLWKNKFEIISGSFQSDVLKCIFPISRFICVIRTVRKEKAVCNLGNFIIVNLFISFSSFMLQEILTLEVV